MGWRVSATWPTTPLPMGMRSSLHLRSVADLEAHAQLVSAVVEQENGEDAVMDDGAHQLGGAVQQGLQIERGVERVGQLHQVGHVGRFHADVDGIEMRAGVGRVRGAVIAFQLVVLGRIGGWSWNA